MVCPKTELNGCEEEASKLKFEYKKLKQSNYLIVVGHNFIKMNCNSEVHVEVEILYYRCNTFFLFMMIFI